MNRRGFLSTLAALTATAIVDPEKLVWTPGKKKIFIPPAPKAIDYRKLLEVGDVITFEQIYLLNPVTGGPVEYAYRDEQGNLQHYRPLQQFVVIDRAQSGFDFFPMIPGPSVPLNANGERELPLRFSKLGTWDASFPTPWVNK